MAHNERGRSKEKTPAGPRHLRERTTQFALRIVGMCCALPKTTAARVIGKQVLPSGTSAGAHYREACRVRYKKELPGKLQGGLAELEESAYWPELLAKAKINCASRVQPLGDEAEELLGIFVSAVKTARHERSQ